MGPQFFFQYDGSKTGQHLDWLTYDLPLYSLDSESCENKTKCWLKYTAQVIEL